METSDILSVASRRRIYQCVDENPGAHLREVARRCSFPLGTTLYHLDYLESNGLIVARRDGRYKRYFGSHSVGRREKQLLCVLRHDVPRRIVATLLERKAMTQRELCAALGVSRSTLSFHVNRLVAEGAVQRLPRRPEGHYVLVEADLSRALLDRWAESLVPVPVNAAPAPVHAAEAPSAATVAATG